MEHHETKEEEEVTTPRLAQKPKSHNAPRTYAWPPRPPYEFEVMSSTSAINGGLPKPFLVGWAAKLVAETAVDDIAVIQAMVDKGDEQGAIAHLKGAPYRKRQAAADRGTLVHAAIEGYIAGKTMEEVVEIAKAELKEERVPPKLHIPTIKMISGLVQFLQDEEPEILWSEKTVFSRTHGYAGTPDIIARMRVGGTLQPVVIDVKTSKGIYDETALQLVSYARADFVGLDDGTEKPLLPKKSEKIEFGVVVRPKPSGGYETAVFTLTDDVYELFLHCLAVANLREVLDSARRP